MGRRAPDYIDVDGTRPFQAYLGKLLDRLAESGFFGNEQLSPGMPRPSFSIKFKSDDAKLSALAYQNAVDNATCRAKQITKMMGRSLGKALNIREEFLTSQTNNFQTNLESHRIFGTTDVPTSNISLEIRLIIEFELID